MTTFGRNDVTGGRGFWQWLLVGVLALSQHLATGQQKRDPGHPQGKWEVIEGCTLSTESASDGDSFHAQYKGRTYIFRLYFVDAPEEDPALRERIADQAAYFGITPADVLRGGTLAAQFTREKLAGRKFTVVTRWQNAMGRSALARFYCITLVQGKNLGEELVGAGLARIYGLRANWPEGKRSATTINNLKNLELKAREQRLGLWNERSFARETNAVGTPTAAKAEHSMFELIDVNEASYEELQKLPGIGPKLAERIMANRPLHSVDDLLKVGGIGTKTLDRLRPLVRVEGVEGEK